MTQPTTVAHQPDVSPVLRGMRIGQHMLFMLLLVIGAVRALPRADHFVGLLLGVVAFAAWYVVGAWLARRFRRRAYGLWWLAALVAGWVALVIASAEFSWVAFSLFLLVLHLLRLATAVPMVFGIAAVVVAVQLAAGSGNAAGKVIGPTVGALVAIGTALAYRRLVAENEQRRRLVRELVTAQDDLVATHDELATTHREAGALAERARLARDIHDTLAQGFSSIVLLSRAGLSRAAGDDRDAGDVKDLLRQIETTAVDNLDEARRVVHALAPTALEAGSPLTSALQRLLDRLTEQAGVETQLVLDETEHDTGPIPTTYDVALLRLCQGALANVREHADATRVTITLALGVECVRVDIVDDGRGFDPELLESAPLGGTGFGVRAMRQRLVELGGTLRVESAPGEGTAVVAVLPLGAAEAR